MTDGSGLVTLRQAVEAGTENVPPSFHFTITVAGDPGSTVSCDASRPGRLLVGKSRACDLCVADPLVSRRHLALEVDGWGLHLTDLGSTNGTAVNGVHVKEAWLKGGEAVVVGETELTIGFAPSATEVTVSDAVRFGRVLGASLAMRRLYPLCERLAATDLPVLIEGESGTGKDLLAESLHEASARRSGPFVVFDCGATPPTLVESALFGHERGAFTGATATRVGAFEAAHGGTLFLDELGELPLDCQPRLLGALARGAVQRVGSNAWVPVDVRVIAATRRDVDQEVQDGRFREDLYYRLAVARIEMPPLRRRGGDITRLARHFHREITGSDAPLPRALAAKLEASSWPGNVRELENAVARYVAIGDLDLDGGPSAPPVGANPFEEILEAELPLARARERLMAEFERRYIERVLARHGGNVSRAAASSGLARRYFQILNARRRDPK